MERTNDGLIKTAAKGVGAYVVGLFNDTSDYIGEHPFVSMFALAPSILFYTLLVTASVSSNKESE